MKRYIHPESASERKSSRAASCWKFWKVSHSRRVGELDRRPRQYQ